MSVVLPTYNEEETIRACISQVHDHLTSTTEAHEIIVVDDSPDWRTADIVEDAWGNHPHTHVIRREGVGLASAVVRGFTAASGRLLAVMDADLQHPPDTLVKVYRLLEAGNDVVVGSRHVESGRVAAEWPWYRQATSWGAALLAWLAVPQTRGLADPMSGLFGVRAGVLEATGRLDPCGYKILLEVLARAPSGLDIAETGYVFQPRAGGGSNLNLREYVRYLRHLARLSVPARQATSQPLPRRVPDE